MADAADTIVAPAGQAVLTIADLNTAVNHEPRISHQRLAEALEYDQPHKLAHLIERHRKALETFGSIPSTVDGIRKGAGRRGKALWLNKRQALYVLTKSEMPKATEATIIMVTVFDEHLRGTLPAPKPIEVRSYRRAAPRKTPALPPPTSIPTIDRDGLAILRIGGETLFVDTARIEPGPDDRVVCFDSDGKLLVEPVKMSWPHANWCGRRFAHVRDARPGSSEGREHRPGVWVIGVVMAALPERAGKTKIKVADRKSDPRGHASRALPRPTVSQALH